MALILYKDDKYKMVKPFGKVLSSSGWKRLLIGLNNIVKVGFKTYVCKLRAEEEIALN